MKTDDKLKNIIDFVKEKNGFYQKTSKDSQTEYGLQSYPIIKREDIQLFRDELISEGYKSLFFSNQLRRQSSSGSSGMPVSVYWDYKDWYASNICLWRMRKKWYNITSSDRYVMFTLRKPNNSDELCFCDESKTRRTYDVTNTYEKKGFERIWRSICEYNPVWMYVQPTIMNNLLDIAEANPNVTPTSLRYVEFIGEMLPERVRDRTKALLGVVVANMYGSEEMNCIAYECPHNRQHILTENVFVEVFNDGKILPEGYGTAIITSLSNYAMPLIRYEQGDLITLVSDRRKCECGSNTPWISQIEGRKRESFTVGGKEINSYFLSTIIDEVNNQFNFAISDFCYTYKVSKKKLTCKIDIREIRRKWEETIQRELLNTFWKEIQLNQDALCLEISVCKIQRESVKRKILYIED